MISVNNNQQMNAQRYGSITNLPLSNFNNQNKQPRFGGSELNLSLTNDVQNKVIPPKSAASITNLNTKENDVNVIVNLARPPKAQPIVKTSELSQTPPSSQSLPQTQTTQSSSQTTSNFSKYSPGTIFKNFFK